MTDTRPSKILDDVAEYLRARVRSLSDAELRVTKSAARGCNMRNCPFMRYDAARALLPFLEEEARERPIRRRQGDLT